MKLFGFAGYSGSGKTTLIEKLIPLFVSEGYKVSLIKHAHHDFDIDKPGKDSYRHRAAGCSEVLVTSRLRWAIVHELRGEEEPTLSDHIKRLSPCDIVFVEGYKSEAIPKLEICRKDADNPFLFPHDPHIVGVVCDFEIDCGLPKLPIDSPNEIASFIKKQLGL